MSAFAERPVTGAGRTRGATAQPISGFDGLRALAALSVVSYHVALGVRFAAGGWYTPLLWELKGGVAIFFVVSGALLYLPYARAISNRVALPDWRAFARRRAVRILPAYWVALTVFALGPFHVAVFGSDAWRYYGLSQIYGAPTVLGGLGVAWSLCVELTFYACLPLFACAVSRLARRAGASRAARVQLAVIVSAGVASVALRGVLAGSLTAAVPEQAHIVMVTLPGLFDWFAIGMGLAVLRAELEAGLWVNSVPAALGRRPGLCVLLAFTSFCAALPWQGGDLFLPWYGLATHVGIGIGSGLLVLVVMMPAPPGRRAWPLRVLAHPIAAWMGMVSYGVYLWHVQALMLIEPHVLPAPGFGTPADALLVWAAGIAAGLALGAASYHLVERPCQRLFRARRSGHASSASVGRMTEISASVHSTVDPLNSTGVTADHMA